MPGVAVGLAISSDLELGIKSFKSFDEQEAKRNNPNINVVINQRSLIKIIPPNL
jgi:hypothetical protein